MNSVNGGYDEGYKNCPCFWGTEPASYVKLLGSMIEDWSGKAVLDVGCGEGKNAAFAAERGAKVKAWDVSQLAISNAKTAWSNRNDIEWSIKDIRSVQTSDCFDIIIGYGVLHCLSSKEEIERIVFKLQSWTSVGGYHVICSFNNRSQDLSAHPGFFPCLISHDKYASLYDSWEILSIEDKDLYETHPHNGIEHHHSLTRLVARKVT